MEIKITKIDSTPRSPYIKGGSNASISTTSTSSTDGAALEYINNMFVYDAENQAIKANYSLYSVGDLSAYGLGSTTSGGTGGFTDEGFINFLTANGYSTSALTINYLISGGTAAALDTLNELSAALGNDPNFATTVSNTIGSKWTQDDTKINNWDSAYTNNHTHTNKSVLDGINATTVSNWDSAYSNNHTHTNKTVLDNLTDANILNWNTAYSNNHTHSNLATLTGITSTLITNWNTAYTNNHTHSNKTVLDTLTVNNTNVLSHLSIVGGKLQIDIDAYSTGELAAYGLGTTTTGGGTSYNRLDLWGDYSVDKAGYVLSAYLGNDLNSRLSAIEGNGATTITTTGAGNAITSVSKTGTALTFVKDKNFSLDGHSHSYLPLSGGMLTGYLVVNPTNGGNYNEGIRIGNASNGWSNIQFGVDGTSNSGQIGGQWIVGKNPGFNNSFNISYAGLQNSSGSEGFRVATGNTGLFFNGNTIWHSGNDGAGSGLDADLLDGFHAILGGSAWNKIPIVASDGVIEIGKYIDFHSINNDGLDYSTRLQAFGTSGNVLSLPTTSGTLAMLTDNVASATYSPNSSKLYSTDETYKYSGNAPYYGYITYNNGLNVWDFKVSPNTPENVRVYMSDRLTNTRYIWGQPFNGEGNVTGNLGGSWFAINDVASNPYVKLLENSNAWYLQGFANKLYLGNGTTYSLNIDNVGNATHVGYVTGLRFFTGFDAGIANSFSCSNWFRSNGSSGWFNDTYSGGIHMTDSTYVRIYNYKSLWVDNNIVATGEITAYSASDRRLKTDIQQLTNSLDIINKLNPVSYKWNDVAKELNPNKTDLQDYGLIAQELEEVLPNLVHNVYDKYKSIDYVKLVPFLVASVKELHNKNIELERRIEELSK